MHLIIIMFSFIAFYTETVDFGNINLNVYLATLVGCVVLPTAGDCEDKSLVWYKKKQNKRSCLQQQYGQSSTISTAELVKTEFIYYINIKYI